MSDHIDELAEAIDASLDTPHPALNELATIAREAIADRDEWIDRCYQSDERALKAEAEADRWRKVAIHLATVAAEASVPTHFTTTDAIARATEYHLASAMFCQDDGTLFRHPENALDAARKVVTRGE